MTGTNYTKTILDGKYEVLTLLGEGGMGAVYFARHIAINKPVAVKFLHSELSKQEEVIKRFYREAQAAASIRHNNIVDVMDLGVSPSGEPYIVMEYLEGEGLSKRIEKKGPLSLPAACGVFESALLALGAAHEKGIVHRDLKPDNIFLVHRKGELPGVKIIDFGISKFIYADEQTKITQDGSMLGTPAYMSPEQARGLDNVDHRTDLYAMGVILYELLTGDLPFIGSTYSELLINMITTEPRDPIVVFPNFPTAAKPILQKALQKNPDERYQSAEEMLNAIRGLSTLEERILDLNDLADYLEFENVSQPNVPSTSFGDTQLADNMLQQIINRRSDNIPGTSKTDFVSSFKQTLTILVQNGEAAIVALEKRGILEKVKIPFKFLLKKTENRPLVRIGGASIAGFIFIIFLASLCSEKDVTIAVNGVPEKAKIFFDGKESNGNPFGTDYSDNLKSLKVEISGQQVFEITIIPNRNQTIDVHIDDLPLSSKSSLKRKKSVSEDDHSLIEANDQKSPEEKSSFSNEEKKTSSNDDQSETEKSTKRKSRFNWRTAFKPKKKTE